MGLFARFFALFFCLMMGMNVWGGVSYYTPAESSEYFYFVASESALTNHAAIANASSTYTINTSSRTCSNPANLTQTESKSLSLNLKEGNPAKTAVINIAGCSAVTICHTSNSGRKIKAVLTPSSGEASTQYGSVSSTKTTFDLDGTKSYSILFTAVDNAATPAGADLYATAIVLTKAVGDDPEPDCTPLAVKFAAGGGTGSMTAGECCPGKTYTIPACGFTAPAGKEFDAWTSTDVTITDGKFTMPANAVTVTATWKKAPIILVGTTISASVEPLEDVVYGIDQTYTGGVYNVSGGMTGSSGKRYIKFTVPDGCTADVTVAGYGSAGRYITLCTEAVFDGGSFAEDNSIIRLNVNGASSSAPVSASTTTPIEAGTYYVGSAASGLNISTVSVMVNGTPVIIPSHSVTYAKGEATCEITMPTQVDVKENKTFTVADAIACDGLDFLGWNDGTADYAAGATYTMGTADVVLTAQWQAAATKHTVIYMNGAEEISREDVTEGQKAANVPSPKKELNTFAGWEDAEHNAIDFATKTIDADLTVYAKWTPMGEATSINIEQFVIDNTKSGDIQAALTAANFDFNLVSGDELDDLVADESKNDKNCAFRGLKLKHNGSFVVGNIPAGKLVDVVLGNLGAAKVQINGADAATALVAGVGTTNKTTPDNYRNSHNYYYSETAAVLKVLSTGTSTTVLKGINFLDPFVVTFANGGDVDPISYKAAPIVLPAATGEGEFQGWFDAATEGNKIGDEGDAYTPSANITLFAQFSAQSSDNSLKTLKYGETSILEADKYTYDIVLPYKSVIPASVTYEANSLVATPAGEQTATVTDGTATFSITAENGDAAEYTVNFTVAPKDGVLITKTATTGSKNQTITGVYGDTEAANMVNIASDKKLGGSGQWIGVALVEGQTFAEGDIINVHTTTAAGQGTITIYSNTGKTATKIADLTSGFGVQGDNKFTLPAGVEAYSKLYVARTDANKWNGYVDFVAVTRVMNPILSALTVAGVDAVINQEAKTITVKLPNGTVAADAVLVPTIVANGGEPTAALAEALSYNTPVNYVVTDKDGDQTTYVLTATEAAAPAATPVITVQPASHDYEEGAVIAALTVEATVSDAGVLSYQWYKGEEIIAGATAASYTPTEAGSYKVVVTNTLGEETATATSEVAVITVRHIYTFNDWTSGATFTKTGEWTLYPIDWSTKELTEDVHFAADQNINKANDAEVATAFTEQYFVLKFEKPMKELVILDYCNNSRYINNIYTLDVAAKKTNDVTSKFNKATSQDGTTKVSTTTLTTKDMHFEAGVYYVFKTSSSSCNAIFDIFTTAATVSDEFEGLVAGSIAGVAMTDAQLAELNAEPNHTLTLVDAVSVAPAVEFSYKHTVTYDDAIVTDLASATETAVSARVGDNYEISKEIEGITYKVVVPVDVTPALALDVTEGTAAIAGKTGRSKEFTVTLTGANLSNGEYSVTVPAVDGLTVTPAAFTVAAGEVNETFTITYASDADVAEAIANIDFTVGTTTATFALTYSSVAWVEPTALEDVTESITWDFASIVVTENVALSASEYTIYSALVSSTATFDGAKIAGKGQWATRPSSDNFFQGDGLKFHTTVPGFVKITYRGTGSQKDVNLFVNGEAHGHVMGAFTASDYIYVPAGDVEITFSGDSYGRVNKLEFKLGHSRTGYQIDGLGTICLPFGVNKEDIHGAVFYEVNYANCSFTYFDEVDGDLIAGKAYIFKATAADVALFANSETVTEPLSGEDAKGFIGTFVDMPAGSLIGKYVIALDNKLHICGAGAYLAANRAYIDMDAVPTTPTLSATNSEGAPRRRLAFGGGNHIATDINALDQNAEAQKVLMDGVLYIIRAGKTYTPAGQLVK